MHSVLNIMSHKISDNFDCVTVIQCNCEKGNLCITNIPFKVHAKQKTCGLFGVSCSNCTNSMKFRIIFCKTKYLLTCIEVSNRAKNNEYITEKILHKIIYDVIRAKFDYPMQIVFGNLLCNVERIVDFRINLKYMVPHSVLLKDDNIIIRSRKDFYVCLFTIFRYFNMPSDITKIISSACYVLKKW